MQRLYFFIIITLKSRFLHFYSFDFCERIKKFAKVKNRFI